MAEKKLRESQVDLSRIDNELTRIDQRIDSLGKVFNYQGRVDRKEDLPPTGKDTDLWLVGLESDPDKAEYFWDGGKWEYLGNTSNQNYATTTTPGIVELATKQETVEGDDATKAVTPAGLKEFGKTKADLVNGKVPDSQLPAPATEAASKDLSNTGRITNCITKIPQDIKLELSTEGTLTLKAGSKVYDGAGNVVSIANDISGTRTSPQTCFVFVNGNSLFFCPKELCFSGDTEPILTQPFNVWYDTENKEVKYTQDTGVSWTGNMSLPVCITTSTGGKIDSIDKVFNGFGYIGKTLFALPGVEGLLPNGRNADGSLNNKAVKLNNVFVYENNGNVYNSEMALAQNSLTRYTMGIEYVNKLPDAPVNLRRYYVIQENKIYNWNGTSFVQERSVPFAIISSNTQGKITSFETTQVFRAIGYSEYKYGLYKFGETKVSKTGDVMTGDLRILTPGNLKFANPDLEKGADITKDTYVSVIQFLDKNNQLLLTDYNYILQNGSVQFIKRMFLNEAGSNTYRDIFSALYDKTGKSLVSCEKIDYLRGPTPAENSNDTNISTTAWVRRYGVNKSGDTMAGELKLIAPNSESNDNTAVTSAWVRTFLQQEKTKLMGIPNTKAGVDFYVSVKETGGDDEIKSYTAPSNGIILVTTHYTDAGTSANKPEISINGKFFGDVYSIGNHIYNILSGDVVGCNNPGVSNKTMRVNGVFYPYL